MTPIPKTQVFPVSAAVHGPTNVATLTVSAAGAVAVKGANNVTLGNFQVMGATGSTYSAKCSPPGGAPVNVKFTLAKATDGSLTASGTFETVAFTFRVSSSGQLLSGGFPELPASQKSFFAGLTGVKLNKLLPITPTPTHPEPEEKMVARGTGVGPVSGAPVSTPEFNGRCAGAVVLFIIAAAASEGISAVAGAAWLVGECHGWSFNIR